MLNPPKSEQLLEAVSAFLRDEALPALTGAVAYKARIAANVLDIVRREHEHSPGAQVREAQALRALLGNDDDNLEALNRKLCECIGAGQMDLETPGVAPLLWQITLDKLTVDQPGYDTYRKVIAEQTHKHKHKQEN